MDENYEDIPCDEARVSSLRHGPSGTVVYYGDGLHYPTRDAAIEGEERHRAVVHPDCRLECRMEKPDEHSGEPACSPTVTEVVYVWPDGREEVRYRRPFGSSWACDMILEVDQMITRFGAEYPYSYRHV